MTESPQAPMPETMLPISQADLDKAGFPASAPMAPGLAVFFNDALYLRCRSLAVIMAEAEGVMPKHLLGHPQACFAVISRAITWNLDPYAVAMCTYQTPGGSIGFEGKLVQAILEASGKLVGGVKYTHVGDWSKVKGKFEILSSQKGTGKYPSPTWTREDAKGLTVIVSAQVKGENQPRELTFDLETAFPLNSPLWATAPERQVCYTAVRAFANQAMPGVLMGLPFDYEEPLSAMATIAPPRPQKKGAAEFDRTQEAAKADTKFTATAKPDAPKANGEAKSEVAETVAAKDEVKAEVVKPTEPVKTEPELPPIVTSPSNEEAKMNMAAPAEREPGDDSATIENLEKRVDTLEKTAAEELAQWYRDQVAEIAKSTTIKDLAELRDMVVQNVDDTQAAEFKKLCGARAGVILNGELVETKTVKQVTDLRGKYTAVLGSEMGQWFNKLCDDRQRAILEATRKTRQK